MKLGIAAHNSYFGCQKCEIQGVYSRRLHKMCFPRFAITENERENELRTDLNFRNRTQRGHHLSDSILEELPTVDMVKSFPVSDSLHLFDLGIMKRYIHSNYSL